MNRLNQTFFLDNGEFICTLRVLTGSRETISFLYMLSPEARGRLHWLILYEAGLAAWAVEIGPEWTNKNTDDRVAIFYRLLKLDLSFVLYSNLCTRNNSLLEVNVNKLIFYAI